MIACRFLLILLSVFVILETASGQTVRPAQPVERPNASAVPPSAPASGQTVRPAQPVEKASAPAINPSAPAVPASPAQPQITFNSVYVEGPYIALTFDDGPHATLTPKLLDLLAKHHMKATFFVVGQCVVEYPDIVKRAAREGHEIASHSWSHPNLGKMSDEAVRRELQKTDDAIAAAIGKRPTLMRPPYGSITANQKRWYNSEFGYRIIIWDVDPLDWKRPGPSVVTNRILKETKAGSIILAHDIHPPTLDAMPATLEQLAARGFKSVTVSDLLAMAKTPPPKPATPKPSVSPRAGAPASPGAVYTPPPTTTSTPEP